MRQICSGGTLQLIGFGVSGYVYEYKNFAFKVISNTQKRELEIMKLVGKHRHLIPLENFFYVERKIILQMPFAGHNGYVLTKAVGIPDKSLQEEAAAHLFAGLDYLHSNRILHLDPKPENTFYYSGRWQLADLGNARLESPYQRGYVCYTLFYRCPLAAAGYYSRDTDIFATALCVRELITGAPLFDCNEREIWKQFAAYFDRADVSLFLPKLSEINERGLTHLLMNTASKQFEMLPEASTPFLRELDATIKHCLLNFTCFGAKLFIIYWLDKLAIRLR